MNEFQDSLPGTDERTRSERHIEAVRQEGGVFVEAVRVTRMPMLVTDATLPGNPITFANPAFVELSGYTLDQLLGQDPHFMNGETTDPNAIRQYEAAMQDGRDETLEIVQYRKDGTPFRAMLFACPLDDGQGTVTTISSPISTSPGDSRPKNAFGRSPLNWRHVSQLGRRNWKRPMTA